MLYTSVFAWNSWYISILWIVHLIWFIGLCNTSTLIEARIKHSSHAPIPLHWHLPLYLTNGSSISMVNPQTHWSSISVVCHIPLLCNGLHPPHLTNESSISMVNPQTHWSSISVVCPLPLLYNGLHTHHLTNGSSISMVNPQTHWSSISVVCPIPLLYIGLHPPHPDQWIFYIHGQPTHPLIFCISGLSSTPSLRHILHTWPMDLLYPWSTHRPIDLLYQ